MNVISNDTHIADVFGEVYKDLLARQSIPYAIVFQTFGPIYNLTILGSKYSVNMGDALRHGQRVVYLQPRRPLAPGVTASEKHAFTSDDTVKLSFVISYFFLMLIGPVDIPTLRSKYSEIDDSTYAELLVTLRKIDQYIHEPTF